MTREPGPPRAGLQDVLAEDLAARLTKSRCSDSGLYRETLKLLVFLLLQHNSYPFDVLGASLTWLWALDCPQPRPKTGSVPLES